MTDTADAFLTGHGVAVPLGEIETALTQLWGPAAEREGGPPLDHPTVTRVALANLVVGALDDPTDRVGSLLQAVLSSYPSRAIVARSNEFLRLPSPCTVGASGGSSAAPSGSSMPRLARNERTPSSRRFPSTYAS